MCRKTLVFSLASNRFVLKITRFESRLFVLTRFRALRGIFSSRNGSSTTPRTKRRSLCSQCRKNLVFRICELGLYSRDIGVTSRYFGQDSEYIVPGSCAAWCGAVRTRRLYPNFCLSRRPARRGAHAGAPRARAGAARRATPPAGAAAQLRYTQNPAQNNGS